jgi:S1-C subfamily serine protease
MPARADLAAVALLAVLAGCRPRVAPDDATPGTAAADGGVATAAAPGSATPRLLYAGGPPSFSGLVDQARPSVVSIRASEPVKGGPAAMFPGATAGAADPSLGTGFLVEARGVHVVTTDRIAAAAPSLRVVLADGSEVPARVVGRDPRLDVALLAIDVPRVTALALGDSDQLAVGEWTVVLGNPFGAGVTASAGILSATGKETAGSLAGGPTLAFRTYLETDARIHRGNSGGPVLDAAGKVVGLAVATGDRAGELNLAVPINQIRERLEQLREVGAVARSWLGIKVQPIGPERARELGVISSGAGAAGALVTEVVAGSPAQRADLRPGDVVLRWDDQPIDARTLPWKVETTPVGRAVAIAVRRGGAEVTATVTTEKMPE